VIKVKLREKPGRYIQLYYVDPLTKKEVSRSAKTVTRAEANRAAAIWEQELAAKGPQTGPLHWDSFRIRFESEHLPRLSVNGRKCYRTALTSFERLIGHPTDIKNITVSTMSEYATALDKTGISTEAQRNYIRHIKSALSWAAKMELIAKAPRVIMPRAEKGSRMKGRPVTEAELLRLAKAAPIVRPVDHQQYSRLIQGLYLSGLRIAEAMRLTWDPSPFYVDLHGSKFPKLVIQASGQKARRNETCPITPDFAEFLLQTPESEREGRVFPCSTNAAKIVSEIARAAGVAVTAHDLRRSFGTRWSVRVMPVVLQKMMRHRDIKTTLSYYIDHESDDLGAIIWGESVPVTVPKITEPDTKSKKKASKKAGKKGQSAIRRTSRIDS
jgi:integrase